MKYDFAKIESKWQKKWADADLFAAKDNSDKPKFYGLVEFPYPSGAGMHVGHIKAYSGLEVVSRKRRMQGYNVLFPIGFDAFGLPAENYAIKMGVHPAVLSSALEGAGTVTSALIPWNTCGVFIKDTLNIAPWGAGGYGPWAIFNWLMPIINWLCVLIGWTLKDLAGKPFKKSKKVAQ